MMAKFIRHCPTIPMKKKVLIIMGSTGTGKSKLSISIGSHFPSEIINSDKIQVYKGLDIITNKITHSDRQRVPHHLLGIVDDPDIDFTMSEFCHRAHEALTLITQRGNLPIIVGGSNNYLEALIEDPNHAFHTNYDCCFIWLDVSLPILFDYLDLRVDKMLEAGLLDEIREAFVPGVDYSRGVRRAIGIPELDQYIKFEREDNIEEAYKEKLLKEAIQSTKENTNKLAKAQLRKIHRLKNEIGWDINKIDATKVFEAIIQGEEHEKLWEETVFKPSLDIVKTFLDKEEENNNYNNNMRVHEKWPYFQLSVSDGHEGEGIRGVKSFCLPRHNPTSLKFCLSIAPQVPTKFYINKFSISCHVSLVPTITSPSLKFF